MRWAPLAILFLTSSASAIPAPMSDAELAKNADIVIEAEVQRVECAGPPVDKGEFVAVEYRSELAVVRALAGKPTSPITLSGYRIEWKKAQPEGSPPTPPLPKGWRGKAYLDRLPGGGWVPVWYNGLQEDPAQSKPEPLPECSPKRGCSGCTVPNDADDSWLALLIVSALLGRARRGRRRRTDS